MRIKRVFTNLKNGFTDFRRGLSIIFGKPEKGEGDRKLARLSKLVMGQIPAYGKDVVRTQVIKSIESDFKRAAKKNGKAAIEKLIQNALSTPEYMQLLRRLNLEEPHIRVMAMEALKKYGKTIKTT